MANPTLNLDDFLKRDVYGIYDELPVGIGLCDSLGRVVDCNDYYLKVLGISKKDIIGYNIFDSYNFTDEIMDKIRTSDSYTYDVLYTMPKDVFINASADTISISVKIVRCKDDCDSTAGYIIYITNHTNEWKKYEKQLNVQDRRYRDLVDNLPLNYTHTRLIFDDNGQIVDYLNMSGNKSCEDFYIAHNMTWGTTLASKFLPETGSVIIGKLNELRNSGATGGHFTYDAKEVGEIYEMVVVFEGEEWVNLISTPVTSLENEKREAELRLQQELIVKEKAELRQKQAEAEYNKRLEEQHAIFDALADNYSNVYIVNPVKETLKILKLNGYVTTGIDAKKEKIYTYTTVKNQYVSERVLPEDQDMMMEAIALDTVKEALKGNSEYIGNYRVLSQGETHYYQFKFLKLKDVDYIIAGFQNVDAIIAEQKTYQEQLTQALAAARQASGAKTTFLNNMSHDIRTPMNAIIGFTTLAQTHIDDQKKVEDYLGKISTSGTHLLNLINDILDMSRIESGTVKLEEKPVNILDFMKNIRTMVQGLANSKNLNLYIETQSVLHEDVLIDELRLNQVLLNIVSNAIKFTPAGGDIVIKLTEKPCFMKQHATYEFTIKDNGIGMSQDFLGHIFETFSREHSSTVSGVQGTGLGMAIAKNIVDMMDGDIQVESEEGKGSQFTVTLNLSLVNEVVAKDEEKSLNFDFSDKHVLLVEDNELNREIAITILEETGMIIDSVEDGDIAVDIIGKAPADKYDLILMDIQMPRMDGYAATREIRSFSDDKKANIPIVAMTANAFEEDRKKAYESGMNGHIIKPISIEEIGRVLSEIFDKRDT